MRVRLFGGRGCKPQGRVERDTAVAVSGRWKDGYINHLLNASHYLDDAVLEYGVFRDGVLIAVAECGIDEVCGLRLNDCCRIRFGEGEICEKLYRTVFEFVVNDVLRQGVLPFDNLQHGEYAQKHGGFTAIDMGFETVMWGYRV